jgi:hypothetical protein
MVEQLKRTLDGAVYIRPLGTEEAGRNPFQELQRDRLKRPYWTRRCAEYPALYERFHFTEFVTLSW